MTVSSHYLIAGCLLTSKQIFDLFTEEQRRKMNPEKEEEENEDEKEEKDEEEEKEDQAYELAQEINGWVDNTCFLLSSNSKVYLDEKGKIIPEYSKAAMKMERKGVPKVLHPTLKPLENHMVIKENITIARVPHDQVEEFIPDKSDYDYYAFGIQIGQVNGLYLEIKDMNQSIDKTKKLIEELGLSSDIEPKILSIADDCACCS